MAMDIGTFVCKAWVMVVIRHWICLGGNSRHSDEWIRRTECRVREQQAVHWLIGHYEAAVMNTEDLGLVGMKSGRWVVLNGLFRKAWYHETGKTNPIRDHMRIKSTLLMQPWFLDQLTSNCGRPKRWAVT
jgi:hypothetical protein